MEVDIMVHQERLRNSCLFFIFLFFIFSCDKTVETNESIFVNADSIKLKASKGVSYYKGTPFTGTAFTLGENQKDTLSFKKYLSGKKHGTWTSFYPDKSLREKRVYVNGSKEGQHVRYWPDGKIRLLFHLKSDEYNGNSKTWNRAGMLISDRNFLNGHENGAQRVWYDNGKIKSNFIIKNNRRYGLLGTKNCINVSDSLY